MTKKKGGVIISKESKGSIPLDPIYCGNFKGYRYLCYLKSYCTYDGDKEYLVGLPSRNQISKESKISLPTIRKYDNHMREIKYLKDDDSFIQSLDLMNGSDLVKRIKNDIEYDYEILGGRKNGLPEIPKKLYLDLDRDNYFVTMSRKDLRTLGCIGNVSWLDKNNRDWVTYVILYCRNWLNISKGKQVMIYPSKVCESAGVDIHSTVKVKEVIEILISRKVIDGELKDRTDGRGNILYLKAIDMTPLESEINLQ